MIVNFFKVEDEFGELSNYWLEDIEYDGIVYSTAAHLYQALKYIYKGAPEANQQIIKSILNTKSPYRAELLVNFIQSPPQSPPQDWQRSLLRRAKKLAKLNAVPNPDFNREETMQWVLDLKFTQNKFCKRCLISTGDSLIVFAHYSDQYWGMNKKGGENRLGELLMNLRRRLKN
jgi:predicted NAD-dependent protein-ADP-ribosyltransferase YbiA (DUF1768 family)